MSRPNLTAYQSALANRRARGRLDILAFSWTMNKKRYLTHAKDRTLASLWPGAAAAVR